MLDGLNAGSGRSVKTRFEVSGQHKQAGYLDAVTKPTARFADICRDFRGGVFGECIGDLHPEVDGSTCNI